MTNPCIDLLQLAVNLNASSELEAEVIQLLEVVKPSALSLASQLAGEEAARGALHWYHLTYSADWAYKSQLRFGLNQQKFDAPRWKLSQSSYSHRSNGCSRRRNAQS